MKEGGEAAATPLRLRVAGGRCRRGGSHQGSGGGGVQ
jgi:hypothetical protein